MLSLKVRKPLLHYAKILKSLRVPLAIRVRLIKRLMETGGHLPGYLPVNFNQNIKNGYFFIIVITVAWLTPTTVSRFVPLKY
jgi:hypothetical protein